VYRVFVQNAIAFSYRILKKAHSFAQNFLTERNQLRSFHAQAFVADAHLRVRQAKQQKESSVECDNYGNRKLHQPADEKWQTCTARKDDLT
jgi:hypothetical protein